MPVGDRHHHDGQVSDQPEDEDVGVDEQEQLKLIKKIN